MNEEAGESGRHVEDDNGCRGRAAWNRVPRVNVLGVGVSSLSLKHAVDCVIQATDSQGFVGYVTVTGVHGVMESQKCEELKRIHNRSFLSTPDGMPMLWMGKWNGHDNMTRVYGPDLMLRVLEKGSECGLRHFLFGGKATVAEQLAEKLEEKYEGVKIVGKLTPPFRPLGEVEEKELLGEILEKKPHCIWVGLSTPKQERFMAEFIDKYREELEALDQGVLFFGVGAAFDIHAGLLKQAPKLMQKCGLEWLFRLMMEPRRLWKRYSRNNIRFIYMALQQMSGAREFRIKK